MNYYYIQRYTIKINLLIYISTNMKSAKIAIIGGGFFGSAIAIELKKKFRNTYIDLYEKKCDLLMGTSGKNQFRSHRGYHYPRSLNTFLECETSSNSFEELFRNCLKSSDNFYSISKYGSKTSFNDYINFLDKVRLKYKIINRHPLINREMSQGIIQANEKLLDINKARVLLKKKLHLLNVNLLLNTNAKIDNNFYKHYDLIVLSTYDNNNLIKSSLNIETASYFYQLVEKVIIETPNKFKNFSCVILDGDFISLDPFDSKKNLHITGHVTKSVLKSINTKNHMKLSKNHTINLNKYFLDINNQSVFKKTKKDFKKYFNYFEKSKYHKSFFVVRCTKKNKKDERITSIDFDKKIISVHSGKWINCVEAGKSIANLI